MNARHRGASTEARTDLDAEGPLRRWARRKREVAREKRAEDEARGRVATREPGVASEPAGGAPEAPAAVEEVVLTDEDMPPLDSLDENSDYSGFLSSGVSEELRRRALRKLFTSAVFNVPDGLDDYDDDFTTFAALGDIVTSDMKHQAEMEAERAKRARAQSEPVAEGEEEAEARAAEAEPLAEASDGTDDMDDTAAPDDATAPDGSDSAPSLARPIEAGPPGAGDGRRPAIASDDAEIFEAADPARDEGPARDESDEGAGEAERRRA